MKRRLFLAGGLGLGFAAASGIAVLLRQPPKLTDEVVAALIRRKLDYMTLDDDSLRQFARDLKVLPGDFNWRLPVYVHTPFLDGRFIDDYAERISAQYLLSTDFFYRPKDVTGPPKYLAFYVRAQRPCAHPFAQFHFDDGVV